MDNQIQLNMTFLDEIVSNFILDRKAKKRSPNTILFYQSELTIFNKWCSECEVKSIGEITPTLLRRYFIDLGSHRSKGGVYANFKALKAWLIFFENEFEPVNWKNPIFKAKQESNKIPPLPGITIDNVSRLIESCSGEYSLRNIAILHTLVNSGCRANELINLTVSDVNLITGQINVRFGKGDKQRVSWLFSSDSRKAIRNYLKTRENLKPNSPLFVSDRGRKFTYHGLKYVIKTLSQKAEIDSSVNLHDFRRCFGLTLFKKKVDIYTISKLLGHTSIEITKS